jgi:trehalose/maltose hydrolase-like predicted phosphorylase
VALAFQQYVDATGDQAFLAAKAWPVLSGVAAFWASRATGDPAGGYNIAGVMGPDEYHYRAFVCGRHNPYGPAPCNVSLRHPALAVVNSAYTNVAAQQTLRAAVAAGTLLNYTVPANWSTIAGERGLATRATPKGGVR